MSGGIEKLLDPAMSWLSTSELAGLAGIDENRVRRACRRCVEGDTWRRATLQVRRRDGKAYEVFAPSLPPDLYEKWLAAQSNLPVPVQETAQLPALPEKPGIRLPEPEWIEEAKWKLALIEPALAHPPRSRARGDAVAEIAAIEHAKPAKPDGRAIRIGERTLSDWIRKYETSGLRGLVRQRRHDAPRVFITREWDAACPLPKEAKAAIAEKITAHIKSLWRSGNPGCNDTARLATSYLQSLCHEAGWGGATLELCRISRHLVERYREYSLSHTARKDAKAFFDNHRPRIRRDHSRLLPLEQVVGDVHPIDVLVRREDGSTATPRFIAWYDVATHRLDGTLVLLDKNKGVTQADVWASFAEMVEKWGLPTHLYLDNGSEYNGRPRRYGEGTPSAVMAGFDQLTSLALAMLEFNDAFTAYFQEDDPSAEAPDSAVKLRRSGVTRAMPYNAPGKTGIEGAFAALETIMAMGPGYIGGNRMKKRTPKLGKETPPWPDMDSFSAHFRQCLNYFNGSDQIGNLDGKSPNQAFADAQQDGGWKAIKVKRAALIYAMSETKRVTVRQGTVMVGQQRYKGDELIPLSGQKIAIRYAKWAPEYLAFWPDQSKPIALLERDVSFHPFDREGAREASRRNGVLRDFIKSLEAETEELDMVEVIARHTAAIGPAPATVFGPTLGLGHHVDALAETAKRLGPPAPQEVIQLQPGESVDPETGEVTHVLARPNLPPVKRRKEETNPLASYQRPKKQGASR